MSSRPLDPYGAHGQAEPEYVPVEVVPANEAEVPAPQIPLMPVLLFLVTCYTTYKVGGFAYALPLLGTLLCHEMGHYLQARRYHVPASLPYFIPMPIGPLGTMGAVIGMRGHMGNRKALFDIGISGPLAGLLPALVCCVVGLHLSNVVDRVPTGHGLGAPLLFQWLVPLIHGPIPPNHTLELHMLAYAGWVGVFITALNLIPISQLDGGHVLYALLREKAHYVAWTILIAAFAGVVLTRRYEWSLMLFLLIMIGPSHPPTANDNMPLGTGRIVLGWLTLCFVIIGFTPTPFT